VEHLGKYVEGLSEENLKVGVWSGKLQFKNLKLKKSALDALDLPVEVEKGSLKSLVVLIPWASLDKKPVKVFIDGIYLQASPINVHSVDREELKSKLFAAKRKKLCIADTQFMKSQKIFVTEKDKINTTYTQRLTAKILDNLEVVIKNIHFRYEDSVTIPGVTFAAGITLDQFSIQTTNDMWVESFIARDAAKKKDIAINKLAKIDNISIYWNTSSPMISILHPDIWEAAMLSMIYTKESALSPSSEIKNQYVLVPPNNITIKLVHLENAKDTDPKIDLTIEGVSFELHTDRAQLLQVRYTLNYSFSTF
jgi:vacuolar protein sorting-associated protein 13A/C